MNPELLEYFHRELQFLLRQGPEFARRHPDIAPLLELPPRAAADPHVERLLQAFAWINARVHMQLDGLLPGLAEAFFSVLYPHAQRPFPACAVVQFSQRSAGADAPGTSVVPRGALLESEPAAGGLRCRFRTVYPVALSGAVVEDAVFEHIKADTSPGFAPSAKAVLRLRLRSQSPGRPLRLDPERTLRLFLRAPRGTAFPLYEMLVRESVGIAVSDERGCCVQQPGHGLIRGVGFGADDDLLPQSARVPAAHQLLQEFFAFPEKFLFLDVGGLPDLQDAEFSGTTEVAIYFRRQSRELETLVSAGTIRLDCTPVVNLFSARAEPVALTHERVEYPVRPDARFPDGVEVYSVDGVDAISAERVVSIREFYEPRRPAGDRASDAMWLARRAPRARESTIPEVWLGLADPSGEFLELDKWTLDVRLTCLNGDLPSSLPYQGAGPRLHLDAGSTGLEVECIVPPTRRLAPPLARQGHGKLVALLALQSLPLFCDNPTGEFRLREYLGTWNPNPSRETQSLVESLVDARARQSLDEVWIGASRCFARGIEVQVEVDEGRLPGRSACLFSTVLEHFLSQTSSINCFTRLVVHSAETHVVLHRSAPRAGDQMLTSSLTSQEPLTSE